MVGVGYRLVFFPVTELPARFLPFAGSKKCLFPEGFRATSTRHPAHLFFALFWHSPPGIWPFFANIRLSFFAYFYAKLSLLSAPRTNLSLLITDRKIRPVLEAFLAATNDDGPNDPPFKSTFSDSF